MRPRRGGLRRCLVERSLYVLAGGRDAEKTSSIQLEEGSYQVCLDLRDSASGGGVLFSNTQDMGPYNYILGEIQILY